MQGRYFYDKDGELVQQVAQRGDGCATLENNKREARKPSSLNVGILF